MEEPQKKSPGELRRDQLLKYAVLGILGAVLLFILLGVVSCTIASRKEKPGGLEDTKVPGLEENVGGVGKTIRSMVLVHAVGRNRLDVYDIDNDKTLQLQLEGKVELKNAYGQAITLTDLRPGDILEAKYDERELVPESLLVSGKAWTRADETGVEVDAGSNTIRLGSDRYSYTKELILHYRGEPLEAGRLHPADVLFLRGYQDKVWYVEVLQAHGTIRLENSAAYAGGNLQIDGKPYGTVSADMEVAVTPGIRTVEVVKEGMEPFSATVMVEEWKTAPLDLQEAVTKEGTLEISLDPGDALATLDGNRVEPDVPLSMAYGSYVLKVSREGFSSHEETVLVDQAYRKLTIRLERMPVNLHVDAPVGAELYVDGAYVGIIPVTTPVRPGNHVLTARMEGFLSVEQVLQVDGNAGDLNLRLPALEPAAGE
ncbi:PEGA domain-containing protein [Anaerotalea alkaliphila]|uniref:PEGA domain-containing protein n=1 Tax=Anaerotalea alkaliphila TaxID=2662126 RepID=A0A7X5HU81_9FIRM|nr:PEGA domain-containing protein [Anaerotalea alkaliphila]NDL66748.1 PEGA domain-containing protein [Anaerotalea alkaliphila]